MEIEVKQCIHLMTKLMVDNGVALSDIITDLHDQGTCNFLKFLQEIYQLQFFSKNLQNEF